MPRRKQLSSPVPKAAYSIDEFCAAYGISKSTYFKIKANGEGPREMKVAGRILISIEAAQAWNRAREKA
jgi:hypothetical protein